MYDAVTRSTYADLYKLAEAQMPSRVRTALVKVAARQPAVRDALIVLIADRKEKR